MTSCNFALDIIRVLKTDNIQYIKVSQFVLSRKHTAFQRHLIFFSKATTPPQLMSRSRMRAALSIGLNLPVAIRSVSLYDKKLAPTSWGWQITPR